MNDEKRICLICETPYQVYNAINLRSTMMSDAVVDVFIGEVFFNATEIAKHLNESSLFNNTFTYKVKNTNFVNKIYELFFPRNYLKFLVDKSDDCSFVYSKIFMSSPTHFSMAMVAYNRNAEVVYFDDGIGSYIYDIGLHNLTPKRKICYKLGFRNIKRFEFSKVYLYSPQLIIDDKTEVAKLEVSENERIKSLIDKVFDYHKDSLYHKKIVYFAMPSQDFGDRLQEEKVIEVLEKYKEECIVRLHPRENNPDFFNFASVDRGINQWELIAKDEITDQHILIGIYSTAQVVPKTLFDKEPYIIFQYKLYRNLFTDEQIHNMEKYITNLRNEYRNPEKIIDIESYQDFDYIINMCMNIGIKC